MTPKEALKKLEEICDVYNKYPATIHRENVDTITVKELKKYLSNFVSIESYLDQKGVEF